jgi:uncharacterized protein YebE (UPF0316 family)
MNDLYAAGGMALLATTSVGLWTLRVALTARGRRSIAATAAAVEAVIFAVAFTNAAAHLDSPIRLAGYAAGVAFGTVVGLTADHRLSPGVSEVDIVLPGHDPATAQRLHRLGWPATTLPAHGPHGPVTLICIAVDDSQLTELTTATRHTAPTPSGPSNASAPLTIEASRRLPADHQLTRSLRRVGGSAVGPPGRQSQPGL